MFFKKGDIWCPDYIFLGQWVFLIKRDFGVPITFSRDNGVSGQKRGQSD
jgi:hypothetical protein